MSKDAKGNIDLTLAADILAKYSDPAANMVALLQDLQEAYSYLPESVLRYVSKQTAIPASQLTEVASFYAQFRMTPPGKNQILVCMGTACHVNSGEKIVEALENYLQVEEGVASEDGLFSWEKVACLGCCSLSPVMMINGVAYGSLTGDKAVEIVKKIKAEAEGGEA